jgi:hypothetical protein
VQATAGQEPAKRLLTKDFVPLSVAYYYNTPGVRKRDRSMMHANIWWATVSLQNAHNDLAFSKLRLTRTNQSLSDRWLLSSHNDVARLAHTQDTREHARWEPASHKGKTLKLKWNLDHEHQLKRSNPDLRYHGDETPDLNITIPRQHRSTQCRKQSHWNNTDHSTKHTMNITKGGPDNLARQRRGTASRRDGERRVASTHLEEDEPTHTGGPKMWQKQTQPRPRQADRTIQNSTRDRSYGQKNGYWMTSKQPGNI